MNTTPNYNSIKNQSIKEKFVSREILANVNGMVEYILQKSYEDNNAPFTIDDCENYYTYPEWSKTVLGEDLYFEGGTEDDKQTFLQNFDRLIEESEDLFNNEEISEETHERNLQLIEEAKTEFEEATEESEPADVYEWWLVTGWLCEKLKQQGQVVIESEGIWGRKTTGQAILLDAVISRICEGMEILEGQQHEWELN